MDILFGSIVFLAFAKTITADVSHLFFPETNLFQAPHQQTHPFLYAPPPALQQNPVQQQSPPIASTTEFFLPEVIANRRFKNSHQHHGNFIPFNHYLPPPVDDGQNPNQNDQTPSLTYLPSKNEKPIVVQDEPLGFQGYEYNEPSTTTTTVNPNDEEPSLQFPAALLPPAPGVDNPIIIASGTQTTTTRKPNQGYHYEVPDGTPFQDSVDGKTQQVRLHVKEMRCLEHKNGFFRAILSIESFLNAVPTIENESNDPKCTVRLNRNLLFVNIEADDFQKCGVHNCGKELCLRLRFPSIRGIRTGFDSLLALRCTMQNRVAAKTHALKMGISNDILSRQAKNTDTYAHGGSQNEFRTHIDLLRKTSNGFTKKLDPNELVRLGEELLLRAHVGPGDGWNFTKLTDVNLQTISGTGEITRSINLITPNGCVNPSMRSICPQIPIFEPPLGHRFVFRAVMFQDMRSGDEMVLSMKITGCLEQTDCQINLQDCNGSGNIKRQRRHAQTNSTDLTEFPKISFHVEMPFDDLDVGEFVETNASRLNGQSWILFAVLLAVVCLCLLGVFVCCVVKKSTNFVAKY